MKLTEEQVKKVAKLSNLPLSDSELEKYSEQLSEILGYIEKLEQADTENVEPTFNVSSRISIFREDESSESLSQEDALKNSMNTKNGMFVTKGVFENE